MSDRPASVGHYRILEKIGEGGMGEVYRALDTRLDREVAIKALPASFSRDPERMARFEREAKLLAVLNHPGIAAVHGFERAEGASYLVMELVPGEDLAERLARGRLPVDDAVAVALRIAEALESAHERGIVHRDLKPGNVKLLPDGGIKLLDFGLAKVADADASAPDLSRSPTITGVMTAADVLLGTAAYMAPEQARGQAVDKRADVWAFGVVLFEMLTGNRAFRGDTVTDTLALVLQGEPPWSVLPRETPVLVRELIRRCLTRDPRQRLRDIGEARIALQRVLAGETAPRPSAARGKAWPWVAAAAVTGAALAWFAARALGPDAPPPLVRKLDVIPAPGDPGPPRDPAVSPDGARVAYVSNGVLWMRDLDGVQPRRIDGGDGAYALFWSPDGQTLGFLSGRRVLRVPARGGAPATVCEMGGEPKGGPGGGTGATWLEDDRIVFTLGDGPLWVVPAGGGDPAVFAEADPEVEQDMHDPAAVPGGGLLVVRHRRDHDADTVVYLDPGGGRHVLVTVEDQRLRRPVYSPAGYVVFARTSGNPGVWAFPFDPGRPGDAGEPFVVVPGGASPSVGGDGTLVCEHGGEATLLRLVETDGSGHALRDLGEPAGFGFRHGLSPDGSRLAAVIGTEEANDVWILDLARGTRTRLTFSPGVKLEPVWSPDGTRIAYFWSSTFERMGILLQPVAGGGAADTLVLNAATPGFSPDGRRLTYGRYDAATADWDLWVRDLASGEARALVSGPAFDYGGAVSPDGAYVAYVSRETGADEVYLARFPSGEGKWQVSPSGGLWPQWSAAGDRLFYAAGEAVMEVAVDLAGAAPRLGRAELRFRRERLSKPPPNDWSPGFAVNGDGTRFYVLRDVEGGPRSASLLVIQNWAAEFGGGP